MDYVTQMERDIEFIRKNNKVIHRMLSKVLVDPSEQKYKEDHYRDLYTLYREIAEVVQDSKNLESLLPSLGYDQKELIVKYNPYLPPYLTETDDSEVPHVVREPNGSIIAAFFKKEDAEQFLNRLLEESKSKETPKGKKTKKKNK